MAESIGISFSGEDTEDPPAKRPCLEDSTTSPVDIPTTPALEDGSDFYDSPGASHPPAVVEPIHSSLASNKISTPLPSAPAIPGLGMFNEAQDMPSAATDDINEEDKATSGAEPSQDTVHKEAEAKLWNDSVTDNYRVGETVPQEKDLLDLLADSIGDETSTNKAASSSKSDIPGDGVTSFHTVQEELKEEKLEVGQQSTESEPQGSPVAEISKELTEGVAAVTDDGPLQDGDTLLEAHPTIDVEMANVEPVSNGITSSNEEPHIAEGNDSQSVGKPTEAKSVQGQELATTNHAGAAPEVGAEWEVDSSPIGSSESDTSDDSSSEGSSEDEQDGNEYSLLSPEEQARILMQGDGGSDDEGGAKARGADGGQLRTTHEKPEEAVPKPDITITPDMKIEELGNVDGIVSNIVLIKAKVSGEYQVLESNSVLCLQDRSVIGVVSETLGRVQQPLYAIRFTNEAAIEEAGLSKGTTVFYVEAHSTFVFTQPLKAIKGSDASNFHDEEVGDDEMEFSDDEAEAEHKRQIKLRRQGKRDVRNERNGVGRDNRESSITTNGSFTATEINYDDVVDNEEDGYTPLARPNNLHEIMGGRDAPVEGWNSQPNVAADRGGSERGHRGGRGRGGRGDRERNNRGRGRGRGGRGGFDNRNGRGQSHTPASTPAYPQSPMLPPPLPPFSNQQHQISPNRTPSQPPHPSFQPLPPRPTFQQQPPPLAPPPQFPPRHPHPGIPNLHTPTITPQHSPYNQPFSPSPISPLPLQQWPTHQMQPQQQSIPPPGSHINPAFLNALRTHQQGPQGYQQQQGPQGHQQQQGPQGYQQQQGPQGYQQQQGPQGYQQQHNQQRDPRWHG